MTVLSLPPLHAGMLCTVCHRQLDQSRSRCRACGTPHDGARHLDLVLPAGDRVPLDRALVIGRAPACELRLEDPSVSRVHARIEADEDGASIEDIGSTYGTFVDGRKIDGRRELSAGSTIELGDCRLEVAERDDPAAANRTMTVPAGISLVIDRPVVRRTRLAGQAVQKPRLRSGWSLKRLDAEEGEERWVLKDHRSSAFVRLADPDAALVPLLDGEHELVELVGEATRTSGPDGPGRLARLLAELADRGLLFGVEGAPEAPSRLPWLTRAMTPRERELPRVPKAIAWLYRHGGYALFTPVAQILLSALAVAGFVAFVGLIALRYGTPFLVAQRIGLGALVFVIGRFLLVVCHETAHGLTAESFGRPVSRAGLKLALVFPYVFVDTTDAWFENRRRRMGISLAGPASDLIVGGTFALLCWVAEPGSVRDVLFQVAFGGYVGALFNLNPLLERDGYHVLVDLLREPGLRRRSSRALTGWIAGQGKPEVGARHLLGYGMATVVWSALTVGFGVIISLRYYHRLAHLAPPALVWTVLAGFYLVLAMPLAAQLLAPLWSRGARPAPAGFGEVV